MLYRRLRFDKLPVTRSKLVQRAGLRDSFALQWPSLMRRANAMQNEIWARAGADASEVSGAVDDERDVVVHLASPPLPFS